MKTIEHRKTIEFAVPIEELFPLFSPEGEKLWVPDWDYRNVTDENDLAEDYVFVTVTHDHGTTEAIWIVKRYDRAACLVEFYKIEPDDKIGVIRVQCRELAAGKTEVEVRYKYIALSVTGEAFISGFSKAAYEGFIGQWRTLLLEYFESKG